jgi:hypothetical protein
MSPGCDPNTVLKGSRICLNGYLSRHLNISGSEVTGLTMLTLEVRSDDPKGVYNGWLSSCCAFSVVVCNALFALFPSTQHQ